jgi:hypothetical protein
MDRLERSGQIRHRAGVFDEFLEGGHDRRAGEELAEQIYLPAKLFVRNWFDEFFGGGAGGGIEFGNLRGGSASDAKSFAFRGELRNQTDGVCARGVDTAAGEEQIADESIAQVAFEAGNAAPAGNETQAKFRKSEARHFVGHDDVASQGQLEAASKTNPMDRGNGDEGRGVSGVEHRMDALQKFAGTSEALFFGQRGSTAIELAQVGPGRETMFASAGNDADRGFWRKRTEGGDESFQLGERGRADFVRGLMVESELNDSLSPFPAQHLAGEGFHLNDSPEQAKRAPGLPSLLQSEPHEDDPNE